MWQRVGAAALITLGVTFFLGRHLALDTAEDAEKAMSLLQKLS